MDTEKGRIGEGGKEMRGKGVPLYRRILSEIEGQIRVHPEYADLQNQLGVLLMKDGNVAEAERHLKMALRLNPTYREALLNLGFLYIRMKHWKKAEGIFSTQAKRSPKNGFFQHVMAICYLQTGRRKEAATRIHKAIQLHPSYHDYYRKIGIWKGGSLHLNRTTEGILKRIPANHYHAHLHNFIGLYLTREGKSGRALKEFKEAAKLEPDEAQFHGNLGLVYYHEGSYSKAIEEYRRALKIDPSYGMGFASLSYIYGAMGRLQNALQCMEEAARIKPHYADLHYNLALLYSDRERYEEAASELKEALRINPNYLFARVNLGVLYEEQKRWKEAKREYRKILRITPEDAYVRSRYEKLP